MSSARREVIAKHTKKGGAAPDGQAAEGSRPTRTQAPSRARKAPRIADRDTPMPAARRPACRRQRAGRISAAAAAPTPTCKALAPAQARHVTRCRPLTLLDRPKAEQKIDERELMEPRATSEEKCREFSVEGQVVQIHPGPS